MSPPKSKTGSSPTSVIHQTDTAARPEFLRVLGGRIDRVNFRETLVRIAGLVRSRGPHHVITGNTLMMLAAQRDASLRKAIDRAALVVPESWGVAWASRRMGEPLLEYIPGIDLMIRLCEQAREREALIYLLGAEPGVAKAAGDQLAARFPGLRVAGSDHGFFPASEEADVIEKIRRVQPDYLFVGMAIPRQEIWISNHLAELNVPVVMGVGGSFDVISGRLRRAPRWIRQMGAEWVFRTLQQPWRLGRIKNLPVFMWEVEREIRRRK